jgi:electron transfer flavoprotein alpha subunit
MARKLSRCPIYSGKLMSKVVIRSRMAPQMITTRTRAFKALEPDASRAVMSRR